MREVGGYSAVVELDNERHLVQGMYHEDNPAAYLHMTWDDLGSALEYGLEEIVREGTVVDE